MIFCALLFVSSTMLLLLGHYLKSIRWGLFFEIYEPADKARILRSISLGYSINFFIPMRIGELFKLIYLSKTVKNGFLFTLATFIVTSLLDLIVVEIWILILIIAQLIHYKLSNRLINLNSIYFYLFINLIIITFMYLLIKFNSVFKVLIRNLFSIFNSKIELNMLFLGWATISSFKDMYLRIDRKQMILYTILSWISYLFSYQLMSLLIFELVSKNDRHYSIFNTLFAQKSLLYPTIYNILQDSLNINFVVILAEILYFILPIILLFCSSFITQNKADKSSGVNNGRGPVVKDRDYIHLIPYINDEEKHKFLIAFFSNNNTDFFRAYLDINRDITIIKDYSSGSNATTSLVIKKGKTFFRKSGLGEQERDKLYIQALWIKQYSNVIPVAKITNEKYADNYYYYDMEYFLDGSSNFFEAVHTKPMKYIEDILLNVLNNLNENLYNKSKKLNNKDDSILYINEKVFKNLNIILNSSFFRKIFKYDYIIINGVKYKNLHIFIDSLFTLERLYNIIKHDIHTEIHGDLTIENIVYSTSFKDKYYLIDPNPSTSHKTSFMDYAKILQSLHYGYEFLVKCKIYEINGNSVTFYSDKSSRYDSLLIKFREYLSKNFTQPQLRSIYLHEIIHYLRLLPYKLSKSGEQSIVFLSALIIALNEFEDSLKDFKL